MPHSSMIAFTSHTRRHRFVCFELGIRVRKVLNERTSEKFNMFIWNCSIIYQIFRKISCFVWVDWQFFTHSWILRLVSSPVYETYCVLIAISNVDDRDSIEQILVNYYVLLLDTCRKIINKTPLLFSSHFHFHTGEKPAANIAAATPNKSITSSSSPTLISPACHATNVFRNIFCVLIVLVNLKDVIRRIS